MDTIEYRYIKKKISELIQLDLDNYKIEQMGRRLDAYLSRTPFANWAAFFKDLATNEAEQTKLRNYITINVSSFYRDADKYKLLSEQIFPQLLTLKRPLSIWSAGCSLGQEPFTFAMMLADQCGLPNGHRIFGSDIDEGALNIARNYGPYQPSDLAEIPTSWKLRYLIEKENLFYINTQLIKNVSFRKHNLFSDPFKAYQDLISCRNVVIYFKPEFKLKLYEQFRDSLRPGGFLFVGSTEIIHNPEKLGFKMVNFSFYQRI